MYTHPFVPEIFLNFCLQQPGGYSDRYIATQHYCFYSERNGIVERIQLHKGKGKVVPVLNYAPRHEDVWGSGGTAPWFLTSALHGGEWSASRAKHSTSGQRAPGTHWTGRWAGHRANLEAVAKRKKSKSLRLPNLHTPLLRSLTPIGCLLSRIYTHHSFCNISESSGTWQCAIYV